MRQAVTTIGELVGGVLVAYGCWLVAEPVGYMAGGVLLCLFSWLAAR